jgi:hypothetical protein
MVRQFLTAQFHYELMRLSRYTTKQKWNLKKNLFDFCEHVWYSTANEKHYLALYWQTIERTKENQSQAGTVDV